MKENELCFYLLTCLSAHDDLKKTYFLPIGACYLYRVTLDFHLPSGELASVSSYPIVWVIANARIGYNMSPFTFACLFLKNY